MTHAARQHVSIHSTLRAARIVMAVVGLTSYLATDAVAQAPAVLEGFVRDATGATVPGAHIDVRGATTAQTFRLVRHLEDAVTERLAHGRRVHDVAPGDGAGRLLSRDRTGAFRRTTGGRPSRSRRRC